MKRIPLEKRLRALATEDTFYSHLFCFYPQYYFSSLKEITGKEMFLQRCNELEELFPEYEDMYLAEIVYEAIEDAHEGYIKMLYSIFVEPFTDSSFIEKEVSFTHDT